MRGRLTLIMGLLGVAFIFITFGFIAWEQRSRLMQRNEDEIRSTAFFLADHTARLLEVIDLTLRQTEMLVQTRSWDEVEASEVLWQQLRAIREALPYIDDVWLNDAGGRLRLTSAQFPTPPSNTADRDAFSAQAGADQGLFVGEPILGRVTNQPTFMMSRRLQDGSGAFKGIVSVTVSLSYFNDYWGKLRVPKGSWITLLRRGDGKVIAQYPPPADGLSFVPIRSEAWDAALAAHPQAGLYAFATTGKERVGAYHQVADRPLYINVSMPEDSYRGPWIVQTRLYGAFALIALLALLALTALAVQQFQEQAAVAALLEKQVALRTGELQAETVALEILNRTGSALAGELEIERIIENVVDAGVQLTGAQRGAFYYHAGDPADGHDGMTEHYGHYTTKGAREAFAGLPLATICAPAFVEGKIVRLPDIGPSSAAGQAGIRSLMAIPVLLRTGKVHGVLLFGHERPDVFTERAERLLKGLAAQATIGLENGRLYQDAQREIEERRQAQAQQSLLIRELHHRVKNTLATVQAVVGATARSTTNIDDFYKAFVGRIISLANTHSLLTEAVWQTASLRDILEKELKPYNHDRGERVTLEGPDVELPSEAAVPIGMAVHELTTNAAKYGALSVSAGRVRIAWTSVEEPDGTRLRVTWEERGGPPVSPPQRQGFGSRLLHRVLTTQLNAAVDMAFEPTGLKVSIETVLKRAGFPGQEI